MLPASVVRKDSRPWHLCGNPHRIMRYICLGLLGLIVIFMLSLVKAGMGSTQHVLDSMKDKPPPPRIWEAFPFMRRYYGGIRTLVPKNESIPEYPHDQSTPLEYQVTQSNRPVPSSILFNPYPDYQSKDYRARFGTVHECFLDESDTVRVPYIHSYHGVPQGMPEAVYGSFELLGLSNADCFDRYSKYGPYGYGYRSDSGGVGAGTEGEMDGAKGVWSGRKQVNYTNVRWGKVQVRCAEKNKQRFSGEELAMPDLFRAMPVGTASPRTRANKAHSVNTGARDTKKIQRSAVIIRTWTGYKYHTDEILYLRSLIAELSLLSGGEFTVHFLIQVKDIDAAIWSDPTVYDRVMREALPEEFYGMGTLWSEKQMGLIYSGLSESWDRGLPVHGVYRGAHLPLQYFAHMHPEYEYFWNWEMDVRYTGHWYHFFEKVRTWARAQPRKGLWERNHRFYFPSVHGSWEEFKAVVKVQSEIPTTATGGKWANVDSSGKPLEPKHEILAWGPERAKDTPSFPSDPVPPSTRQSDRGVWGVDEEADLITFNPIFDPDRTNWNLAEDVVGYDTSAGMPPRRTAIVTASRLSRRLLDTMHSETALHQHSMFPEMWPATCALHHGLKAVYVPHPVLVDRDWPTKFFAETLNHGLNGASGGGRLSVFQEGLHHNLLGVTWYYHSVFPSILWKRWLGLKVDGAGGRVEETSGEGRMCLPGVLLHPIKDAGIVVEGDQR